MNKLAYDQAYIVEAREDIQYHLLQLNNELSVSCSDNKNVSLKHVLTTKFRFASINDLKKAEFKDAAAHIQNCNPLIQSNWAALNAIFAGLSVNDEPVYTNNFVIAKSKATSLLSYECCVALDNFDWCFSQNSVRERYEFSETLNKNA